MNRYSRRLCIRIERDELWRTVVQSVRQSFQPRQIGTTIAQHILDSPSLKTSLKLDAVQQHALQIDMQDKRI